MAVVTQLRERRFYPRVACHLLDSDRQTIRNISQSGLYLESEKEYLPNEKVSLTVSFPPNDAALRLLTTVARREVVGSGRYGYGLRYENLNANDFKSIQYFSLYQTTREEKPQPLVKEGLKVLYKTITVETKQQNLTILDPRLAQFLRPTDYFYIYNLTQELREFVSASDIADGTLTIQILHTSATLCLNEIDEPMLLMDLVKKMRELVPKDADYFHNGPMREMNLCADDWHCDRNGDAHVRSTLFGHPSLTLIVRNRELVLGHWQKVALLEFDGPRRREVLVQLIGW